MSAGAAWHAEGRASHKEVSTKHTLVYDAGAGRQLGEVIAAERVSTCEEQLMILNPGTWVESSQKMQLLSTKGSAGRKCHTPTTLSPCCALRRMVWPATGLS